MEQYEASLSFLNPTALLVISVPEEESVNRIMKRAETEGRVDDTPESIQKRLGWSREKTEPVIKKYEEQGIAHHIDGMGTIEEVAQRVKLAVGV